MSKGRKPPEQQQGPPRHQGERATEHTRDEDLLGNQAVQRQLVPDVVASDSEVRAAAAALGHRTALSLRVPPRDAAWTERLVGLIERSQLPEARREAIADRLRSDQATADDVAAAVEQWLGQDGPELRSTLVAAFDDAAHAVGTALVPEGATLAERAEALIAEQAAARTSATPEALTGLCRSLALLVELVWDEEEEEAAPGDYAAEESGF